MSTLPKSELILRVALGLAAAVVLSVAIPSLVAVRRAETVRQLVQDAKDLKVALNRLPEARKAAGSTIPFADLAPYLDEDAAVKRRGGKDEFGNQWGPFVLGQPFRPAVDTVRRCSNLVPPTSWDSLK